MGKLDNQYYPDIDLAEAVNYAKTIYDFPNHTMSLSLFADKNNLKIRGGWTGMILASMKKYGLIEGRGNLRATELAEKILNPKNEQEAKSAKLMAFSQISLWTQIHVDYGDKALPSDFWAYIADKYAVDRVKAKGKAEKIAKLYTKSSAYTYTPGSSTTIEEGRRETRTGSVEATMDVVVVQGMGTIRINAREQDFEFSKVLPFTKGGLNALKKLIEFLETQIKPENEEVKT
jgi:hypothetical protein